MSQTVPVYLSGTVHTPLRVRWRFVSHIATCLAIDANQPDIPAAGLADVLPSNAVTMFRHQSHPRAGVDILDPKKWRCQEVGYCDNTTDNN